MTRSATDVAGTTSSRSYPSRPILAASLAVVREGRILLAARPAAPFAGLYTLPGGGVEIGESLEAAALREMREEVDIEARILAFNRHVEVVERDGAGAVLHHYVIASFVGLWVAGEGRTGPEASHVVWASRADVAALPTTEHLLPLLDAAWTLAVREEQLCA